MNFAKQIKRYNLCNALNQECCFHKTTSQLSALRLNVLSFTLSESRYKNLCHKMTTQSAVSSFFSFIDPFIKFQKPVFESENMTGQRMKGWKTKRATGKTNHPGWERRRESMRDGGEGEGEASEAALWDRRAPGVRVGLSASLSCCSPIAPHSRRLRESERSMASYQEGKSPAFWNNQETYRQVWVSHSGKTLTLSLQSDRDTFWRKTYCHDAGMSVHHINIA